MAERHRYHIAIPRKINTLNWDKKLKLSWSLDVYGRFDGEMAHQLAEESPTRISALARLEGLDSLKSAKLSAREGGPRMVTLITLWLVVLGELVAVGFNSG